ncbi:SLATT domain-containing protein [Rhizobium sp. IBUN]|uniref:SLATT domain-containing protein n=1 Tax=Rhizobium sp. IBUN TaxID=1042326 RepID=UPI0012EC090E|nr:SLATT domain-containing protein [Rhizobium sp. IBUN]
MPELKAALPGVLNPYEIFASGHPSQFNTGTKLNNVDDRIWITSRVRMIAERKALRNQNVSYLSVTFYSLFTVILSIFSKYYVLTYPLLEEINLSASVIVLVASLVAGGFRFESRANTFRECYLKLQKLESKNLPPDERLTQYTEILDIYPNHSNRDYYDLIINHTYWEGKELKIGEKPLNPTLYMWLSYISRRIFYYASVTVLFAVPLIFLAWPLFERGC